MIEILIPLLVLIVSLAVLAKASDKFTEAAEKIGLHMGMSAFVVGVTIVAVGTSLPELISSVIAVIQGNSEIVAGNVVGSNITNILLVLGISAVLSKKIKIKESFIRIDLMVFVSSAFILVLTMLNGTITLPESIILLLCFLVYITYILKSKTPKTKNLLMPGIKKEPLQAKLYITLLVAIILIFISAFYTIGSIEKIAIMANIGQEIIAATLLALGTSLPELAVSVAAARKGKPEIAIGNILGSNIFNTFAVVGIAGLFGTLIVTSNLILVGSFFLILSTLLYFFTIKDRIISRWEGIFLLLLYALFIIQIMGWA